MYKSRMGMSEFCERVKSTRCIGRTNTSRRSIKTADDRAR